MCDGDAAPTPRPKLIDGLLLTTGLCFLGGQGSAGKTFIAVGIAVALATGTSFFGRAVNEQVGTLIIAAEGREDMQARITAAKKHLGIEIDLPVLWMAVPVFNDTFLKDLDRVNAWMNAKHNVRLGAVMLDTVSASFDLKEEDDNAEAAMQIAATHWRSCRHCDGATPSFRQGSKSRTAWRKRLDGKRRYALAVNADIAPDGAVSNRSLVVTKDRSGVQGPVSAFNLVSVELVADDGSHFSNLAVLPLEVAPAAAASKWSTNALRNLKRAMDETLPAQGRDEYPYPDAPMVRVVNSEVLKTEFCKVNVVHSDTPEKMAEAQRKAYTRALKAAQDRGLIQVKNENSGGQIVWLVRPLTRGFLPDGQENT
jgi:AAA domain-containing protein